MKKFFIDVPKLPLFLVHFPNQTFGKVWLLCPVILLASLIIEQLDCYFVPHKAQTNAKRFVFFTFFTLPPTQKEKFPFSFFMYLENAKHLSPFSKAVKFITFFIYITFIETCLTLKSFRLGTQAIHCSHLLLKFVELLYTFELVCQVVESIF